MSPTRARRETPEREAALYHSVVVPRYSALFGQMILREIEPGVRATVLDVGCGTGHPAYEILRRLDQGGRVIAVDHDTGLLEIARRRALGDLGRRIFFKVESASDLSFGDDVFDVVVCNLLFEEPADVAPILAELLRVGAPHGRLLATAVLRGTFEEVLDMFREVALAEGLDEVARRTDERAHALPELDPLMGRFRAAGLEDVQQRSETFRLPFRSARELFADPLVRLVAMPLFRAIAGEDSEGERILGLVQRHLDVYFGGGPLSLTVRAGLLSARFPTGSAQ